MIESKKIVDTVPDHRGSFNITLWFANVDGFQYDFMT
jgi:hypothetical protein